VEQRDCVVIENRELTDGVFSVSFEAGDMARTAQPGMFVHVRCGHSLLLRRPISIADAREDRMTIVFEVKGDGTLWLSRRAPGSRIDVLGPLGNGFGSSGGDGIIAVGGGMGAPPLLFAARTAGARVTAVLGFRDSGRIILEREFTECCDEVYLTTDDGSAGERGTVEAPLRALLERGGGCEIISCGPRPMLAAVARLAGQYGAPCRVSLEERMGCGVGACLVCACETLRGSGRQMSRVCRDGPVFDSREVAW
jgi:dihydroorotate dehydrogenase electron transfer subunit